MRSKHPDIANWNISSLKIVVVLKRHVSWVEMVVRGSMILFEVCEFLSHLHLTFHHSAKIHSSKDTILRNHMVHGVGFVVMKMLEV